MEHFSFCSTAATRGPSSPQQFICPVLQATLSFTLRMSQSLTKLSSIEPPSETSKRYLGNLYTFVIAIYILWATVKQDSITLAQLAQGTALALFTPLALYSLALACVGGSGTTAAQPAEVSKEVIRPRPRRPRTSSKDSLRRSNSLPKAKALHEESPSAQPVRRVSTMSKVQKAVQHAVCPLHPGPLAFQKRAQSFPPSPTPRTAEHPDAHATPQTIATRRLSFEVSLLRGPRTASPSPTIASSQKSVAPAKLDSNCTATTRSVSSSSSNLGSYGTTTTTTFRPPKFLRFRKVFRVKKDRCLE